MTADVKANDELSDPKLLNVYITKMGMPSAAAQKKFIALQLLKKKKITLLSFSKSKASKLKPYALTAAAATVLDELKTPNERRIFKELVRSFQEYFNHAEKIFPQCRPPPNTVPHVLPSPKAASYAEIVKTFRMLKKSFGAFEDPEVRSLLRSRIYKLEDGSKPSDHRYKNVIINDPRLNSITYLVDAGPGCSYYADVVGLMSGNLTKLCCTIEVKNSKEVEQRQSEEI